MSSLHVLIAGGGIGGLALAQGLRKAGISCAVYESTPEIVQAGYRLHMNATGGNALEECLPENLYELYLRTSRRTPRREMFVMLDLQGEELGTRPHIGPPNDADRPHTAVNRRTLRQILALGLDDVLHFGRSAVGFDQDDEGVGLHFADGTSVTGDVLVAADGINSRIRRQLLPEVGIVDSGLHGMWSTAPLTDELAAALPEAVFDGFVIVDAGDGTIFALGVFDPRTPIRTAVDELVPGAAVDDVAPYVMVTHGNAFGVPVDPHSQGFVGTPEELHLMMRRDIAAGHRGLVELIDRVDTRTLAPVSVRHLQVAEPWPTTRVTLLGDAIHAMPPSMGAGANSALRDAAALVRALSAVDRGAASVHDALAEYEAGMRAEVFPIFRASTDPHAIDTDFRPDDVDFVEQR
ncbi:FAD-dependent oxidoreductase [Microbacterium pygmaeum]|uniref:2-polyprenyl-6-methoxyphenol hydroxylase n=1 Tax=Microbacterium pygmaeum TaxID=370764 RepID=A0A1G7VGF3_9MICO|nr:NAD(P)/FAD-dependent oxidoreductase [Microbacterium pygmaeum]SDG58767.1 2-polyprenyl-6-methoxyphenol hydroxylase [Microbacterium pygmaeum]